MSPVHPRARTTPRTRAEIHASRATLTELSEQYDITVATARKWHGRTDPQDRSHCSYHAHPAHPAHTLHTTLTAAREVLVVELRRPVLLPLDDLLAVTREFINADVSRSGLGRCLRRHGVSDLKNPKPAIAKPKPAARTSFVVSSRPRRRKSSRVLTDNRSQFTDRFTSKNRVATGRQAFDASCTARGIEHRLCPPRHPQTNGMVERFNGRIGDPGEQTRFASAAELETTLALYLTTCNRPIAQRALKHQTPVQALQTWQAEKPDLFVKRVCKQTGLDK